ncbi:Uncharacterised protein at_DN2265 [Pycnogonum litorale]
MLSVTSFGLFLECFQLSPCVRQFVYRCFGLDSGSLTLDEICSLKKLFYLRRHQNRRDRITIYSTAILRPIYSGMRSSVIAPFRTGVFYRVGVLGQHVSMSNF